jgi:inositol-hexakisphosphate 5-kinase
MLISDIAFACLENLTLNFKHPCMMDLKMGSLAYNPLKSSKQSLKIKNSTSGSVGFRISGMEVYQTLDKKIIFRNKYWGRSIKDTDILLSLALFFFNGCCLRLNAIQAYMC